jgi:hypothetical protein
MSKLDPSVPVGSHRAARYAPGSPWWLFMSFSEPATMRIRPSRSIVAEIGLIGIW